MTNPGNITLNDGREIPQFGLGVWRVQQNQTADVVRTAIEAGYRHIDTAQMYRNEEGVGQGVRDSGIGRENVWITTKLTGGDHGYDAAMRSLDESLKRLGTDYADLFLIHWPGPDNVETWRAFDKLREDGRARSIGVSNFSGEQIDEISAEVGTIPTVNQIELNPKKQRRNLQEYHQRTGIATEAWAPIAEGGELLDNAEVARVAEAHGKSPAQAVLRWHLQHGNIVFPKSANPSRIRENIDIADFELTPDEMATIDGLG